MSITPEDSSYDNEYLGPERRQEKNQSWMNDLPVWAKLSIVIGPTAVIALFLTYIGATYAPQILAEVKAMHTEMTAFRKESEENRKLTERMFRLQQMTCIQLNKTESEKLDCIRQ